MSKIRVGLFLSFIFFTASSLRADEGDPIYNVPQIKGINVDGEASDWKDQGFRIEVLSPMDGRIGPSEKFDASVRLAWNNFGLMVWVAVADSTPSSNDTVELGDSVELFVGEAGVPASGTVRYIIAPGDKEARYRIADLRAQYLHRNKPQLKAVSRKTGAGYVVEALIPLKKENRLTFQIVINDVNGQKLSRYAWYPRDDTDVQSRSTYILSLGQETSSPVKTSLGVSYIGLRRARVMLLTTSDLLGKYVEISTVPPMEDRPGPAEIGVPVAVGKVISIEDRCGAYLIIPSAPLGTRPFGPLDVYVDSKPAGKVTIVDHEAERRRALSQVDVNFHPAVFSDDAFPRCDFADPGTARDLIGGGYSMQVDFYNADHQLVDRPAKPGRYGAVVRITTEAGVQLPLRLVTLFKLREAGVGENDLALHAALPAQVGADPKVVEEQQPALAELLTERFIDGFGNEPDTALLLAALAESKPGEGRLAGKNSIWARDQRWWHPLKERLGIARYKCLIDLPTGYHSTSEKYPVLLFLHGSGERGNDLEALRENGPPKMVTEKGVVGDILRGHGGQGFIIVSPQCRAGEWWSAKDLAAALDEAQSTYRIDRDRIYVTGLSMGGYGAWELAEEYPDRFAAIAPVCGAGNPQAAKKLKDLPAWVFHGERDTVVPFKRSQDMVNALKEAGGRVRFTAYPDRGHDSWTTAYANPQLYEWLLKQKRGAPEEPPARP